MEKSGTFKTSGCTERDSKSTSMRRRKRAPTPSVIASSSRRCWIFFHQPKPQKRIFAKLGPCSLRLPLTSRMLSSATLLMTPSSAFSWPNRRSPRLTTRTAIWSGARIRLSGIPVLPPTAAFWDPPRKIPPPPSSGIGNKTSKGT